MPTFIKNGGVWRNTATPTDTPPTTVTPPSSPCEYSIDTVTFNLDENSGFGSNKTRSKTVECGFRPRLILPLPLKDANDPYVSFYNFNPDKITIPNGATINGENTYDASCKITVFDTGYTVSFSGNLGGGITEYSRRYIAFK